VRRRKINSSKRVTIQVATVERGKTIIIVATITTARITRAEKRAIKIEIKIEMIQIKTKTKAQ